MPAGMAVLAETNRADSIGGVLACGDCDYLHQDPDEISALNCVRCGCEIADGGDRDYMAPLALTMTALLLFFVMTIEPLIIVHEQGMDREDFLTTGAVSLGTQGLWPLTPAVLFFSMLAPGIRLACLGYVLSSLQSGREALYAPLAMKIADRLKHWAMLDVFLVGCFVAYTRLGAIVEVEVGPGGWALVGLVGVMLMLDHILAKQFVWRRLTVPGNNAAAPPPSAAQRSTCLVCGVVMRLPEAEPSETIATHCTRCGTALSRRKRDSVNRTWALVIAALIFYIPANVLPVMTIVRFGRVESDTILSGVKALIEADMWPLAAIVFLASIAVPVLKLSGLTLLLLSIHFRWQDRLQDRTRLYRLIDIIGRWSNIDVFMVSILTALVQFGNLTTVRAGPGILPFAMVVLITMFAVNSFDPRLMWDQAEPQS